jgi:hypothetical protein
MIEALRGKPRRASKTFMPISWIIKTLSYKSHLHFNILEQSSLRLQMPTL